MITRIQISYGTLIYNFSLFAFLNLNDAQPINNRNKNTTLNLLRILQKMNKNYPKGTLNLVQWKSVALLKRIVGLEQPLISKYALKLIKLQIPYLGKKWRMINCIVCFTLANTKMISLIYQQLRPKLVDDYIAGDMDTSEPQEIQVFSH